jgi:hypothetical protein
MRASFCVSSTSPQGGKAYALDYNFANVPSYINLSLFPADHDPGSVQFRHHCRCQICNDFTPHADPHIELIPTASLQKFPKANGEEK